MNRLYSIAGLFVLAISLGACTRIEQGHVGVRVNWDKTIDSAELQPGTHSSLTSDIIEFAANEVSMPIDDQHPITHDKTTIHDMDLNVVYSVDPSKIADLYVRFKARHFTDKHGTVYVLYNYVEMLAKSATSDVIAHYDAMDANDKRNQIETEIRTALAQKLAQEGLDGPVKVNRVNIKNLALDPALTGSNLRVIAAQNELRAKTFEVQTAEKEAQRIALLSQNAKAIDYMNASANKTIADAVAAGKVQTIVVPYDFKGIVNLGK